MIVENFPLTVGGDKVISEKNLLNNIEDGMTMQSAESVRYLVIHSSATTIARDYTTKQLLRDHKAQGFRTIGYHFYIRKDGTVTQHRKLLEVGAHCRPWNRCSIGICYEGGLDASGNPADTRTQAQHEQLTLLLIKLLKLFPNAKIRGHSQMPQANKSQMQQTNIINCPGLDAEMEYGYLERYYRKVLSVIV